MDIRNVCLLGGSGFVGRSVADHLAAAGANVRVITRSRPRAMDLAVLPTVEIVVADPHDTAALARAFEGMDAVVNLVGILNETSGQTFKQCHVELPAKIVEACHSAGVRHLVHMSALGASPTAPNEYQRSKAEGEARIRDAADVLAFTILRPSVIFGEGDRFLNALASLTALLPAVPVAQPSARFQPIWVEDVARCVATSLGDPQHFGRTHELGGPDVRTHEQLVRFVCATLDRHRIIVPLPLSLGRMKVLADNVCAEPFPAAFGFQPAALQAIVPEYLAGDRARSRYSRYRYYAGR